MRSVGALNRMTREFPSGTMPMTSPTPSTVPLHDVAAKAAGNGNRALEVYAIAGGETAQVGAAQGLRRHLRGEGAGSHRRGCQACPVHGDAAADCQVCQRLSGGDGQRGAIHCLHPANLFDDAGKHDARLPGGVSADEDVGAHGLHAGAVQP